MELHPSNLEVQKQNGLIGQGTKNKGLTLDWQWTYKPSV
jgi:hypothetical protein